MPLDGSPGRKIAHRILISLAVPLALLQIGGCYYMQAIRGHLEIMHSRQPIPNVIADEETPDELKRRLLMVQEARNFAVDELLLDDNQSYRSYADLERDYVVWNVFAAPEFSLEPKTWCFPVAGCVAYRGYFAEEAAREKARDLSEDGFDVAVGGVSAYSTLGKFSDPVLNTMMRWSDEQLVATIFHELAHQKLYVKGDTAFNESFATAVADIGMEKWLEKRNDDEAIDRIGRNWVLRESMMSLVDDTKLKLEVLYRSDLDDTAKRDRKQELLDELSAAVARLFGEGGADASNWLAQPMNNARLASLSLYEGHRDAFITIFDDCDRKLPCFYEESQRLAELTDEERELKLQRMTARQSAESRSDRNRRTTSGKEL